MNKDWTDKLRDQLAAHEEPVSRDLWADIETKLGGTADESRKARVVALRRWAVAAAVAVLLGGGGFVWFKSLPEPGKMLAKKDVPAVSGQKSSPNGSELPLLLKKNPQSEELLAAVVKSATVKKADKVVSEATATDLSQPAQTLTADEKPVIANAEQADAGQEQAGEPKKKPVAEQPVTAEQPYSDKDAEWYRDLARLKAKAASGRLALGLYAQNGLAENGSTQPVMMEPALSKNFNAVGEYGISARHGAAPIYLTDISEKVTHKIPLSVGLSVAYGLTDRLALQTGLTYTRAASELLNSIRGAVITTDQTLHYVGVPLQLRYDVWRWGSLNTYATAGGQLDVNVKAEAKTEGVTQRMKKDRAQWSLLGGLGLQYDIAPHLGLYGEVGARWYPDNGSQVENYFKDKPLGVNLQVGLRLNVGRQTR